MKIPDYLLPWMTELGFLTKKLQAVTGMATNMEILRQCWERRDWWDRYVLGIACGEVLHREIMMRVENTPCWYARTIIPAVTFSAHQQLLMQLQQHLLGKILFESKKVRRYSFTYYPVTPQLLEYHWLNSDAPILWARRSEFRFDDDTPLYLLEIFLPTFAEIVT